MNPKVIIKDGGVHIITGEGFKCECGIDANGTARCCQDILQDMATRFVDQYVDGKVPNGPILLREDTVGFTPVPDLESPPEK